MLHKLQVWDIPEAYLDHKVPWDELRSSSYDYSDHGKIGQKIDTWKIVKNKRLRPKLDKTFQCCTTFVFLLLPKGLKLLSIDSSNPIECATPFLLSDLQGKNRGRKKQGDLSR